MENPQERIERLEKELADLKTAKPATEQPRQKLPDDVFHISRKTPVLKVCELALAQLNNSAKQVLLEAKGAAIPKTIQIKHAILGSSFSRHKLTAVDETWMEELPSKKYPGKTLPVPGLRVVVKPE